MPHFHNFYFQTYFWRVYQIHLLLLPPSLSLLLQQQQLPPLNGFHISTFQRAIFNFANWFDIHWVLHNYALLPYMAKLN